MALQVERERGDGLVALGRLLAQRARDDVLEIAAQLAAQARNACAALGGDPLRQLVSEVPRSEAHRPGARVGLERGAHHVGGARGVFAIGWRPASS